MHNLRNLILFLVFLLGTSLTAVAIPAYPWPFKVTQADGTQLTIRLSGDEHGYLVTDLDGQPLRLNQRVGLYERTTRERAFVGRRHTARTANHQGPRRVLVNDFPAFGTQRSLVILVEYADKQFESVADPYTYYYNMLNQEGFTHENGAHGSARDFYHASSNGQFDPQFDVVGPIRLPHTQGYYGGNTVTALDTLAYQMVIDACLLADEQVDFSQYDLNDDGVVDNIYFFYAGYGEADSGQPDCIWPHSGKLQEDWQQEPLVLDGVVINRYATSNEIRYGTAPHYKPVGIGTFVHEFGHVLGLADHYDTSYQSGRIGVQQWDTMAAASYLDNQNTPPLFSAFERAELGWLQYTDILPTAEGLLKVQPLAEDNEALRIVAPNTDGREYFIMEHRRQEGWDRFLPGHGLLVWHVDMDDDLWLQNKVNVEATHQRLDLVEADGSENANSYAGDPFPGAQKVMRFDFNAWSGERLFSFDHVEETDTTVNVLLGGTAYRPATPELTVSDVHGSMMTLAWPSVTDVKEYILTISELAEGEKIPVIGYDHTSVGMAQVPLTIHGLKPLTQYEMELSARLVSYESEISTAQVTTTEMEFFELRPVALAPTEVTETGFTARWRPMEGADGYSLTVYQHEYSDETTTVYDFTDKSDGLPAGWTTSSTTYNRALFGQKAPSLQLGKADDFLSFSLPDGACITRLSFWQRSQSKNNRLHIETLADGEWQELAALGGSTQGETATLSIDSCQTLRIRLERKSGYVLIDDVELGYVVLGDEPVESMADIMVGNATSHAIDGLTAGLRYGYRVRGLQGAVRSMESAEVRVSASAIATAVDGVEFDPFHPALQASDADKDSSTNGVYDLMGRRVAASSPANGPRVCIVRRGNHVRKMIQN